MAFEEKFYDGTTAVTDALQHHEKQLSGTQLDVLKSLWNVTGPVVKLIPGPYGTYIVEITRGFVKTVVEPDFSLTTFSEIKQVLDTAQTELDFESSDITEALAYRLVKYMEGKSSA